MSNLKSNFNLEGAIIYIYMGGLEESSPVNKFEVFLYLPSALTLALNQH